MPFNVENLKSAMRLRRVDIKQLASISGMSVSGLNKIYYGITPNPQIDTAQQIAEALNVPVQFLTESTQAK
jgi:transcriptional regulator with XRE-family HTH domain